MNTVCPGFVPHHVRPNRCRRCFRDINDHKDNSDVSTSFTVPLPRRRRDSVAVTETPRRQESQDDSSTVSFTITETSSLGRRTRQRSASTSSWFQDKKEEEEKEINLLGGKKIENSRSSYYRSTDNIGLENEDIKCDSPEGMKYKRFGRDSKPNDSESAEVRIPPARHRSSKTSDRSDSALDLKSIGISENKVSKTDEKTKDAKLSDKSREEIKTKILEDKKEKINELKSKSSALREAKESLSRSSSRVSEENKPNLYKSGQEREIRDKLSKSKSDDPILISKKTDVGQKTESKFDSKNKESKPKDTKFLESKFLSNKVGETKSRDSKLDGYGIKESASTETESKTKTAKPWELKPTESKTKDVKPWELKPAETKKDVKPWELKPAETKKDVKPWESKPAEPKKDVKPWESKPSEPKKDVKPWESKPAESKRDVKPWELKPAESKKDVKSWELKPAETRKDVKPWESKVSETRTSDIKAKEKPVFSRFGGAIKEDSKDSKPAIVKSISKSKRVDSEDETDSDSAKKTQRIQIIAAKPLDKAVTSSAESDNEETSPDVAFVVKVKPTVTNQKKETVDTGKANVTLQNKMDELHKTVEKLKKDLGKSEDKCSKLEKDKNELQKKKILSEKDKEALEKTASELLKMRTKINEMQSTQDEVKDENKRLKVELKDARSELSRREPAERSRQTIDALKQKLQQTESLCQDLMEENEEIKKEVRDLEQELEELHDNFREDQASEFRGLKKELETAAKNCRVLQFKLRKAEKRCEQLELERHSLEDRVREFHMSSKIDVDKGRMKELENELRMARNMTVTMNTEIDALKDAVKRAETENERLRQHGGSRNVTPTPQANLSSALKDSLMGKDYESLAHELSDTMERENDLREQLRFSEDEAKAMRRKLSSLEQENETLMLQMKKLTTVMRARGDKNKRNEEEEEMSAENLKIHLDLMEQEMSVMRRKLEDTEHENESLQSEVKSLQDKIINQPVTRIDLPEPPKDAASPGVYWEYKLRLLEYEVRDTRRKLIERERDIDRLNAEVEIYRKKASKTMVRSRSLDSDMQVDLKRQLQLVEQEASILRQKVAGLETENEKLVTENKRMTLRLSKKPPMVPADLLQLENMELKQKMEEQDRKMTAMKEELEKGHVGNSPVAVLQDYKPRKESLTTDNENDLISSLKKRIKTKDEEATTLQNKVMQLEIDNNRLSREYKKLKDTLNLKKKPPKAVRDSATRVELREVVNELQDEISELQVSLRSREVVQEDLEQELERLRRDMNNSLKEVKQKEEKLREEANQLKLESESLRQESAAERQRAATAQEQLQQVVKQKGSDLVQMRRLKDLQAEKEDLERRAKAAEDALEKKTARLRDTQEKLNVTTALKDEMARSNRMLEAQKLDLEKEAEEHKELLLKAEERANELRSQIDKTDRDLTSLRKECNQLRNELEDERTRLKHADNRQSEVTVGWLKERDDLRRTTTELRNKIDTLQQQLAQNEKIWIEKETRLREDHKKKKDAAVREAREKAEIAVELVREEEKIAKTKLNEMSEKLEKAETSLREAVEKHRHSASQHRREREDWQTQEHELEGQMRAETKRRERLEKEIETIQKTKDEELLQSRDRLVVIEREQRRNQVRISELEEQEQKGKLLEKDLERSKQEYDDLTSKYDQLEEEFVRVKSRLVLEKEQVEANMVALRRDFNQVTSELTALRETYNSRQDSWIKEKLDLQEKLKEMESKLDRVAGWEQEKIRLKDTIDEKDSLIESYRKEEKHLKEEREKLRRRAEDLTKQMDIQKSDRQVRPLTAAGRAESIREVHDMRIRMEHSEKSHQADLAAIQADYEGRMSLMTSEISSMQSQIAKLASERDYYKAQIASVERTAEEIRTGSLKRERARHREEADMARRKVKELRVQTEELKEQMEDSELEKKNLRLQIETDKNSWEIQISELKSKINQLEEQKLLESTRGQTRNFAKTRLELAWEKERNDLQHLLTDSQQLVSDLKGRLEATETERQKEKQASRRQLTTMRSSTDTDYQENRRKMSELHSSLLEVRESHAKLRGMYDRMKREREILLKEREEWRQRLHVAQDIHGKINEIAKDIQSASAAVNPEGDDGAKVEEKLPAEIQEMITKVKDRFAELQKAAAALKDDERFKRTTSFRRAVSAQEVSRPQLTDPSQRWMNPQRVTNYPLAPPSMLIRPPPRQKALQRKSLSLDQSLGAGAADLFKIWQSEGESAATTPSGSLLSLRLGRYGSSYGYESDSSLPDSEYRYGSLPRGRMLMTPALTESEPPSSREGSVAGSVESVPAAVQPKRTLKDKLKLLRRTKSIDVTNLSDGSKSKGGLGTLSPKEKEEKEKSLRSKISKVLRKPLGRSSSVDTKKPALPPKGLVPDVIPKRPTTEKPIHSSARGEMDGRKSAQGRTTPEDRAKSRSSTSESTAAAPPSKQGSFNETTV